MKSLVLTFCLLCIAVAPSNAQMTPEALIDQFFETYLAQGSSAALDEFYSTNEWMTRSQDAVDNLKSQFVNLTSLVGEYHGRDLIVKKQLVDSFVLISYLVKYDRQPMRFTFEFYKPQDTWRAYSFAYDDNFDDELEEAAKINNLDQ